VGRSGEVVPGGELRAGGQAELGVDVTEVILDRLVADHQAFGPPAGWTARRRPGGPRPTPRGSAHPSWAGAWPVRGARVAGRHAGDRARRLSARNKARALVTWPTAAARLPSLARTAPWAAMNRAASSGWGKPLGERARLVEGIQRGRRVMAVCLQQPRTRHAPTIAEIRPSWRAWAS